MRAPVPHRPLVAANRGRCGREGTTPRRAVASHSVAALLRTTLFAAAVLLPLRACPPWRGRDFGIAGKSQAGMLGTCLVAALLFYFFSVTAVRHPGRAMSLAGLAILVAALAEELVFRVHLPRVLSLIIARPRTSAWFTGAVAVTAAQLSFAVSHVASFRGPGSLVSIQRLVTLFVVGLIYSQLVFHGGVGLAASVHAATNLHILSSGAFLSPIVLWPELILWLLVAAALTFTRHLLAPIGIDPTERRPRPTVTEGLP